jgi:hypothetical protein
MGGMDLNSPVLTSFSKFKSFWHLPANTVTYLLILYKIKGKVKTLWISTGLYSNQDVTNHPTETEL